MKLKLKVGDKVKTNCCGPVYKLSGEVIGIANGHIILPYLVSFKGFADGHNGIQEWLSEGHAMPKGDHSCLWCSDDMLKLSDI